jgi:hypothetical protein
MKYGRDSVGSLATCCWMKKTRTVIDRLMERLVTTGNVQENAEMGNLTITGNI